MPRHKHVLIVKPGEARSYTSTSRGGRTFSFPPRDRRGHAQKLLNDIKRSRQELHSVEADTGHMVRDLCLVIIGKEDYDLKVESLEDRRLGIEVLTVHRRDNRLHATIRVPDGKLERFIRKIERYERENTKPRKEGGESRPKNEDLVAAIDGIRSPVLRSFWTDREDLFPAEDDERIWWEVWTRIESGEHPDEVFAEFAALLAGAQFRFSQHVIRFPERLVFLVHGSSREWTQVFLPVLDRLGELRRAKEVPTRFLTLAPSEQREYVEDLARRLPGPPADAPAVCILDFGVHTSHPLLRPFVRDEDVQRLDPTWTSVDKNEHHGTEMAGLAVFGDMLPDFLASNDHYSAVHRLESVRMFRSGHTHDPETWGGVTQASLALAETQAAQRQRVACLAVTANDNGRDDGRPSSWSAAIDEHASGYLDDMRRLYVIAAGNIRNVVGGRGYEYPETNLTTGRIEDPGQSWNALTIGAFTDRVYLRSPELDGCQPLAPCGGLCPSSRTSTGWDDAQWPLKPDIVMEGGNYIRSPAGQIDGCNDLALLTTTLDSSGRLLTWTSDTSAATAQAARLAAILMADYSELWPETIRGLLVHSADWTDEMRRQVPGDNQDDRRKRLRCFGYGVPDLNRARYTVENHVSLVLQGEIQPFKLVGAEAKTNEFILHSLPWPKEALAELHDQDVTVRVTLSYFVEPSPAGRGWGRRFRYASHGLRFALRGPTDTAAAFRRRISTQEWPENEGRPPTSDPISWAIGSRLRILGSIHCDWWTASAAEIAECGQVAVFPVTGWWRERKHLGFAEKRTRYALIITITTPAINVDLYTPIAHEVGLTTEITT